MKVILLVFSVIFITLIFLMSIILSANKEEIWDELIEKINKRVRR